MKRFIAIFIFINVALFLWQCTKNKSDVVTTFFSKDCFLGNFSTSLNPSEHIGNIIAMSDNTIAVLSSLNGTAFIRFYDSHGRLMSMLKIPLAENAMAMNMLSTSDGGYIISSATSSFVNHKHYMPGGYNYYYINTVFSPCDTTGTIQSDSTTFNSRENKSMSYLTKINKNGMVEWSHTYTGNFFTGSSLALSPNNSVLFMTTLSNLSYRIDSTTGTNNNLLYNYADRNKLFLYNINLNGNTNWSKEYDSITGIAIDVNTTPFFEGYLSVNNKNILIQSGYSVLVLNNLGNIISKPNVRNQICRQYAYNQTELFTATLDSSSFYVFLPANTGSGQLLLQYDFNNNIINYFNTNFNTTGYVMNLQCDKQHNILMYDGITFIKYDKFGNIIFNKLTQAITNGNTFMSNNIVQSCDNGYIISNGADALTGLNASTSMLQLIKMDKNGQF